MQMTDLTELPVKQMMEVTCDPVQTPISLDKGLYKHVHLFCLTFSANVGHYMALIEAYRGLDQRRSAE